MVGELDEFSCVKGHSTEETLGAQMLVAHSGQPVTLLLVDGVGRDQEPLAAVSPPMTDGDQLLQAHKRYADAKIIQTRLARYCRIDICLPESKRIYLTSLDLVPDSTESPHLKETTLKPPGSTDPKPKHRKWAAPVGSWENFCGIRGGKVSMTLEDIRYSEVSGPHSRGTLCMDGDGLNTDLNSGFRRVDGGVDGSMMHLSRDNEQ